MREQRIPALACLRVAVVPRSRSRDGDASSVARSLGLTEVLFTCDDTNAASIRVISLRETKVLDPNRPPKRYYWIALP